MVYFIFQFPDTVAFAEEMANNGKIVIVAALDGTYQQKVKYYYAKYIFYNVIFSSRFQM